MRTNRKAGHRRWAAGNGRVAGKHCGDIMSPEKRSRLMSRIAGKNTGPERSLESSLTNRGLCFDRHAADLPGRPDFVFRDHKIAVFVDGDFWHGYQFPLWEHKLSSFWRQKISATRKRDARNFRKLRRDGRKVVRIWEHQVETDPELCADRIVELLASLFQVHFAEHSAVA